MKTILVLLLSVMAAAAGQVATNDVTYQTINAASVNGITNAVSGVSVPAYSFIIQHGAIGSTNASDLQVAVQISFDAETWTTITNYVPGTTNANVATFVPNLSRLNAYIRSQVVTSNAIAVGVTSLRSSQ